MSIIIDGIEKNEIKEINLCKSLDRGIDDMEAGHEMPLTESMKQVTRLREARRNARI